MDAANWNPWVWVLIFSAGFVALTLLLSLLVSVCVALAGRRYGDKLQKKHQKKIRELLPGKDCGRCGCETCDGYARAVLFGAVSESACPYGEEELPEKMLAVVGDMHKLMEDPKPVNRHRKNIWEQKF